MSNAGTTIKAKFSERLLCEAQYAVCVSEGGGRLYFFTAQETVIQGSRKVIRNPGLPPQPEFFPSELQASPALLKPE